MIFRTALLVGYVKIPWRVPLGSTAPKHPGCQDVNELPLFVLNFQWQFLDQKEKFGGNVGCLERSTFMLNFMSAFNSLLNLFKRSPYAGR